MIANAIEAGQERMAFLTHHVSEEQRKSRKGSRKVKIKNIFWKHGFAEAELIGAKITLRIPLEGILPYRTK